MRFHYLLYFCVASYSGGDFFTPMNARPTNATVRASFNLLPNAQDDLATQEFFPVKQSASPLPQAHAHNDYEHSRPLFDALEQGFVYIEADVYLIDGELYVSHLYPLVLSQEKTLVHSYLAPLAELVRRNGGSVFSTPDAPPLQLMVDIKSDANETYAALKKHMEPYQHLLTSFENGVKNERAVTVFLSGNRPVEQVLSEEKTFMCLDGRIEDLGRGIPPDLMPVVSERFSNIFGWEILGQQRTENQWLTLKRLACLTHSEGKKLRLWASPETESVWEEMLNAGCDIINSDELHRLRQFLLRRSLAQVAAH